MSYATIEAAVQDIIQALSAFSDTDVTRGDTRMLTQGSPPYAILYPGGFVHEEDGDGEQRVTEWTILIDLLVRYHGDGSEYTNLQSHRQSIMDAIDSYPTLNGTTGVRRALIEQGDEVLGVTERGASSEAAPVFLLQTLQLVVVEKTDATGGEYA